MGGPRGREGVHDRYGKESNKECTGTGTLTTLVQRTGVGPVGSTGLGTPTPPTQGLGTVATGVVTSRRLPGTRGQRRVEGLSPRTLLPNSLCPVFLFPTPSPSSVVPSDSCPLPCPQRPPTSSLVSRPTPKVVNSVDVEEGQLWGPSRDRNDRDGRNPSRVVSRVGGEGVMRAFHLGAKPRMQRTRDNQKTK